MSNPTVGIFEHTRRIITRLSRRHLRTTDVTIRQRNRITRQISFMQLVAYSFRQVANRAIRRILHMLPHLTRRRANLRQPLLSMVGQNRAIGTRRPRQTALHRALVSRNLRTHIGQLRRRLPAVLTHHFVRLLITQRLMSFTLPKGTIQNITQTIRISRRAQMIHHRRNHTRNLNRAFNRHRNTSIPNGILTHNFNIRTRIVRYQQSGPTNIFTRRGRQILKDFPTRNMHKTNMGPLFGKFDANTRDTRGIQQTETIPSTSVPQFSKQGEYQTEPTTELQSTPHYYTNGPTPKSAGQTKQQYHTVNITPRSEHQKFRQ